MEYKHKWDYCDHCQRPTVICGKCGNNSCNGGSGLEPGHFWSDGNPIKCTACPEANEFEKSTSPPEFT